MAFFKQGVHVCTDIALVLMTYDPSPSVLITEELKKYCANNYAIFCMIYSYNVLFFKGIHEQARPVL